MSRFLITVVALMATTISAQSTTRATLTDPALDALVAEALANAPETASARATVDAARRRIVPAATLPDPFLSATYQNDGRSISLGDAEGSFIGLMASQPLPWPGKLSLAGRVAESEARELESGLAGRANLTIEARVRNAWYDLVLARVIDRIFDERRDSATQIESSVRERYAAGLAVQQDVLRAQIELVRIDELKAAQAATIVVRTAELNRLLGRPQDANVETPSELPADDVIPAVDALIASASARSPELAASRQAIETGRMRIDAAKKNFLPDFVVNGGSMDRAGFEMGPMWQVGVGVSLPLWIERRQKNQLAEAQSQVNARTADAEVVSRELELRTRERVAQLDAALRVAKLYRDHILPLDALSLESALASYQAGKVPFLTVLEALNAVFNDRVLYAGRLAESAKWRIAIDEAGLGETRNQKPETSSKTTASGASMSSMR